MEKQQYNATTVLLLLTLACLLTLSSDVFAVQPSIDGVIDATISTQVLVADSPLSNPSQLPRRDDEGGPDDFGYLWIDSDEDDGPDYNWINIVDGDNNINMNDDRIVNVDMEFDFPFYGETYNEIYISDNGWISFTHDDSEWDNGFDIPGGDVTSMIAPAFHQWYLRGEEGQGIVYYECDEDRAVISWTPVYYEGWEGASFQAVLYPDGNILFQYNYMSNEGRWDIVIGIQNEDIDVGLEISNHDADYIEGRKAILILGKSGHVSGTVTDIADDTPIEGATLTLSNGETAETDAEGVFLFEYIPVDLYTMTASAYGYNDAVSDEIEVEKDETTVVDFSLTHPELQVTPAEIIVSLNPGASAEDVLTLTNDGNGELTWTTKFTLPLQRDDFGDVLLEFAASDTCEDQRLQGVTELNGRYYMTGRDGDETNKIYVLGLDGNLIREFDQPVEEPSSRGMNGITNDGTDLYSCDGNVIVQFNTDGEMIREIDSPHNPSSNIAYDADNDNFWVCSATSDVVQINRDGEELDEFEILGYRIYGLAWHPLALDGFNLMALTTIEDSGMALLAANPETHEYKMIDFIEIMDGDDPTDFHISNAYNPLVYTISALLSNGAPDRVSVFELSINSSWITLDPPNGTVDAASELEVGVTIDSEGWEPGYYELLMLVESNAAGDPAEVAVGMRINREFNETEHFEFTPTDFIHEFTFDEVDFIGEELADGDEIGIFTTAGMCVGGTPWIGSGSISPAYGDDPDTDFTEGFEEGEACKFMIWDADADMEYDAKVADIIGDATFSVNGASTLTLTVLEPNPDYSEHFDYAVTQAYHQFYFSSISLMWDDDEQVPEAGDEVGVFVGDLCIGGNIPTVGGASSVRAFMDDPSTEQKDGFVVGDTALFSYWISSLGEYREAVIFMIEEGDTVLREDGMTTGHLTVTVTDVKEGVTNLVPTELYLAAPYPNPFNETTRIGFGLPSNSSVRVSVFDLAGREVAILANDHLQAGHHALNWRAEGLASGSYFLRLQAGSDDILFQKMLLLR
ncbi:carboxypeptidase regulatory-like domain-containing protein [Calditrichota bacterium]